MTDKFNSIPKIVGLATVMAAIGTLLFEFVYVGVVNDLPKEFLSSEEKVALVLISVLVTASVLAFSWCIYGTVAVIFQMRDKVMSGVSAGEATNLDLGASTPMLSGKPMLGQSAQPIVKGALIGLLGLLGFIGAAILGVFEGCG